ncbi:hypothetical protein Tco_0912428 [Tanacetum coccineum]
MTSMNTRLNIEKLDENIVQKHRGSNNLVLVSNDDTAVAQRQLEDKQPEEKTNTDCLSGLSKVFWAEDTTKSTYLVNRSPSSEIGFKKPIDMLGFFSWLANIKQEMLEPVKVLHGFEFEVEPLGDHTFELARDRDQHLACELFWYREDSNEVAFAVAVVENIYAHESLTFNNTVACEVISKWKAGLKDDMDAISDVYVLNNGCMKSNEDSDGYYWEYTPGMLIHLFLYIDDMVFSCGCKAEIWATKGLLDKAKGSVLGMEIVREQSSNTPRVSQSRFYNGKLVHTLLEGHSILSLEGSLSGDCDVEKNDAGILDKFDRELQTDVQVYVDFDYAMGRSITVMESRYELRLVAGIATGALVKGGSRSEVPAQVKVVAYRY